MFIVSQLFICVGYVLFFISRFRKEKRNILVMDSVSRVCSIVGYACLGSLNGIEHMLYGVGRNIIGQKLNKSSTAVKVLGFLIMLSLLCTMYGLSYEGLSTIMFVISGSVNLFAVMFCNEQGIRVATLLAALLNIQAFSLLGSYASIVGESLCGGIGVLSYLKERRESLYEK